jgi:hypothetical protein
MQRTREVHASQPQAVVAFSVYHFGEKEGQEKKACFPSTYTMIRAS